MVKRGKLEIMRDILLIINKNLNNIRPTPLLRKSGLSSTSFKEYYNVILEKGLVIEINEKGDKKIKLSDKGLKFLEKYRTILDFIDEFDL